MLVVETHTFLAHSMVLVPNFVCSLFVTRCRPPWDRPAKGLSAQWKNNRKVHRKLKQNTPNRPSPLGHCRRRRLFVFNFWLICLLVFHRLKAFLRGVRGAAASSSKKMELTKFVVRYSRRQAQASTSRSCRSIESTPYRVGAVCF